MNQRAKSSSIFSTDNSKGNLTLWLNRFTNFKGVIDHYVLYLSGCFCFSFGANFFIASNLGTDPLDVFSLGLQHHLPITIGIAQGGFAALCLLVWAIWNRRRPPLSPFFTFFFCGSLIDVTNLWRR